MPQARHAYQLPSRPESAGCARRWLRAILTADSCVDAIDAILLIMSELTTNGLIHGGSGTITIVCDVDTDSLTVGVIDYGTGRPVILDVTEEDEYGRGMTLIDALADEWGCEPCDGGKLVYARLKLPQRSAV